MHYSSANHRQSLPSRRRLMVVPDINVFFKTEGHWDIERVMQVMSWCDLESADTSPVLVIISETLEKSEYLTETFSIWSRWGAVPRAGRMTNLRFRHVQRSVEEYSGIDQEDPTARQLEIAIFDRTYFRGVDMPWARLMNWLQLTPEQPERRLCGVDARNIGTFFLEGMTSVNNQWSEVVIVSEVNTCLRAETFRLGGAGS